VETASAGEAVTIADDVKDRRRPPMARAMRPEAVAKRKRLARIRKWAEAKQRAEQAQKESK
jgi:hypothetical protein